MGGIPRHHAWSDYGQTSNSRLGRERCHGRVTLGKILRQWGAWPLGSRGRSDTLQTAETDDDRQLNCEHVDEHQHDLY